MITVDKDYGMRVKLERTARRMAQPEFALACDISKPVLVAVERRGEVSPSTRTKIDAFLARKKGV